jgi:hypothetical protein
MTFPNGVPMIRSTRAARPRIKILSVLPFHKRQEFIHYRLFDGHLARGQ